MPQPTKSKTKPRGSGQASRRSPTARAKKGASRAGGSKAVGGANGNGTSKALEKAKSGLFSATDKVTPDMPKPGALMTKLALKALKKVGQKTAEAAGGAARTAAERVSETAVERAKRTESALTRRLPIQVSIDIAVPLHVAWQEWMELDFIPEGVGTVTAIEDGGDQLYGTITRSARSGANGNGHGSDWQAEVLDERERESFAWQSQEGSDCAGLITFHSLSERLTRIELNLDVRPTSFVDQALLATHIADRHAEADLRRLKARLELINPDDYPEPPEEDGEEPEGPAEDEAAA